jgi:hypothetical protein
MKISSGNFKKNTVAELVVFDMMSCHRKKMKQIDHLQGALQQITTTLSVPMGPRRPQTSEHITTHGKACEKRVGGLA